MSVTSCTLLLLLVCLSLHACDARILAVADKKLEKQLYTSNQNAHKETSITPEVESSLSNEVSKGDSNMANMDEKTQKLEDLKAKMKLMKDEKESLVSVSWRIPKKKHGEKHPGFNLDYSPPKTHPPSHN